jgi:sugar O-acyltransferase (sialic acid O-acetyltransferase NeuD family)
MEEAIIVGAGTYGQVYAKYLQSKYKIIGFIDDNEEIANDTIDGIKILGNRNFLFEKINKDVSVFVPIGNNHIRFDLLSILNKKGFNTPSFIHPDTIIHESVQLGHAVYILPGTNIMPCTVIKDYVMISIGVNISHHSTIRGGCFFSHGVNIGASIYIEEKAYFGIGSTVMTGIKRVGFNSLVGAGSVVINDIPDNAIVAGVPARILRYKD